MAYITQTKKYESILPLYWWEPVSPQLIISNSFPLPYKILEAIRENFREFYDERKQLSIPIGTSLTLYNCRGEVILWPKYRLPWISKEYK